ncbi:sigma-70 family RNA polymerase sigma factor [Saccharibacillus sp. VR-M41]|uniref:Sigma-70 family RNA polymerase sigma factor n=2 Tax=Saccharibacillus alkalitolerans TaxID=2705290 RepID=A0ABX0F1H5_9BACL|nr:sigma-70 family RNA polymerase sigma factor [Saccharibacillus alkalitolerans]
MDDYGDLLLRTACLLVKDKQAAEEAVQDTFVLAYAKIAQLQDPAKLKSWLVRIVINRCRMKQRTWSWRNIFPGGEAGELPVDANLRSAGAEESFMTEWRNGKLAEAVRRIDYRNRECMVLYYFQELTIREIAEQLDTPESTVKSRLMRGRNALKKIWEEEERR